MAVRTPLYMAPPPGVDPYKQLNPFDATMMSQLHELAGYAFATNPNPRIEINGSNGSPITGQPFTDTWWSSGTYTTRVDRFSTAAETPNVFQVTDNYSRIRVVYAAVSLPTGDTNNTQYPLYLYDTVGSGIDADFHLRTMSVTDFVDTFVLPVINQFGGGGQSMAKGGTYYLTTSPTPPNGTLASATPAAVNNEANVAGYSASAIPTVNNTTTNYYVAKVDYSPTTNLLYDNPIYDLPLYFDAGTESIRHHSPASWAALLNPFLRYYLGGGSPNHTLYYNVDGVDGVTNGSIYTDTGIVSAGSAYNTRYVNTNDYRTQEFPTGTAVVISQKRFKIYQGVPTTVETATLEGTTINPELGRGIPTNAPTVNMGWRFNSNGTIQDFDSDNATPYSTANHINWNNTTPTGTWYIRATVYASGGGQTIPGSGGLAMNTWYDLTAGNRQFIFDDTSAFGSYGPRSVVFKIEISRNNNGTNIAATGYYGTNYEGGA